MFCELTSDTCTGFVVSLFLSFWLIHCLVAEMGYLPVVWCLRISSFGVVLFLKFCSGERPRFVVGFLFLVRCLMLFSLGVSILRLFSIE